MRCFVVFSIPASRANEFTELKKRAAHPTVSCSFLRHVRVLATMLHASRTRCIRLLDWQYW